MSENMASVVAERGVRVLSEAEKKEPNDRPSVFHFRAERNLLVAAVRPLLRNGDSDMSDEGPAAQTDHSGDLSGVTRSISISPTPLRSRQVFRQNLTQLQPFSFDLRDSMQRAAREKKLEELRQTGERLQVSGQRFTANPVRRYKPLVLKQSTRPLTIPRSPFSRRKT